SRALVMAGDTSRVDPPGVKGRGAAWDSEYEREADEPGAGIAAMAAVGGGGVAAGRAVGT
ncbi:MAG: hypothetical protein KA978_26260, partial [Deltaproteobacteria bacterium]|nr:hypothetical protein [Deltaproteobacteria bacterium]